MSAGEATGRRTLARLFWWVAPVALGVAVAAVTWVWVNHSPVPAVRTTPAPWGLPDAASRRIGAARLPRYTEKGVQHFHTHLDVFVDGAPVVMPGGIGLTPPYSAVHTHSESGILHVETGNLSAVVTLGQFFTVWGVRLSPTCIGGHCSTGSGVKVFVNGAERRGDPRGLRLAPGEQVTLVIGQPPPEVPASYDCHTAADVERDSCHNSFAGAAP